MKKYGGEEMGRGKKVKEKKKEISMFSKYKILSLRLSYIKYGSEATFRLYKQGHQTKKRESLMRNNCIIPNYHSGWRH